MRRLLFSLLTLFLFLDGTVSAESLRPTDIEQFFVEPETETTILFTIEASDTSPISGHYRIIASDGETVLAEGEGKFAETPGADGKPVRTFAVTLRLPEGFWELDFDAASPQAEKNVTNKEAKSSEDAEEKTLLPGRRFGVVSLPAAGGPADEFFAIDGALSGLSSGDDLRAKLIRIARRGGIAMIRERLLWADIEPSRDSFDWETSRHYETLRKTYRDEKVPMLELFHDAPKWIGKVETYPDDLVKTAETFEKVADHWKEAWSAIEIWNEPEISFGGNLPGDQYAAVWKAIRPSIRKNAPKTKIVSGVMAHYLRPWLDSAAASGVLDDADVFSYHSYDRAPAMEKMVADYRDWLRASGKPTLPLWITECGRPWKIGPERPVPEQDVESACDIVMKGVEVRACGVARYFPFVYPYYEEGVNNFGMMDRRNSPLRAFAAYLTLIRVLGGTDYLGDIPLDRLTPKAGDDQAPKISRARVFGNPADPKNAVVVLYSGKRTPTDVELPFDIGAIRSMTGETVPLSSHPKAVTLRGGLVYLTVPRALLDGILNVETTAMPLYRTGLAGRDFTPEPISDSGIVLRYRFDRAKVAPTPLGYQLLGDSSLPEIVTIDAFNRSDRDQTVDFQFTSDDITVIARLFEEKGPVVLPAKSRRTFPLAVRFGETCAQGLPVTLDIRAVFTTSNGQMDTIHPADRISLVFRGEPRMDAVLSAYPNREQIPMADPALWNLSVSDGGSIHPVRVGDNDVRFDVRFSKPNDRWAYPTRTIPDSCPPERMKKFAGILCRVRAAGKMTPRLFLYEKSGGGSYFTNESIIPADGQWHTALIRPENFSLCSATGAIDSNGQLNPEDVVRLSFGLNTKADEAELQLGEVYFLFD